MISSKILWKSLPRVSSSIRSELFHLSSVAQSETKQSDAKLVLIPKEVAKQHNEHAVTRIALDHKEVISAISGVPEEHIKGRLVRIRMTPTSPMQSGTDNAQSWQMDFESRERWENPLMGWCSSGDPLSNLELRFNSKEAAVDFCQKNGWDCYVEEPKPKKPRVKNYGINFSWNKRTRSSTK